MRIGSSGQRPVPSNIPVTIRASSLFTLPLESPYSALGRFSVPRPASAGNSIRPRLHRAPSADCNASCRSLDTAPVRRGGCTAQNHRARRDNDVVGSEGAECGLKKVGAQHAALVIVKEIARAQKESNYSKYLYQRKKRARFFTRAIRATTYIFKCPSLPNGG